MFKTVLWATDGSTAAERALSVAKSIAKTYDAKLLVTNVPVVLGNSPLAVAASQESAERIEAALQRKVEDLKRDGVTVELGLPEMTAHGVAHAVAEFARDAGADLIVVGTQGTGWLARFIVGGVTRRLLELAPCPVLAVPPEDQDVNIHPADSAPSID
jgi:nucleotide-binding universal stress UspA family protein